MLAATPSSLLEGCAAADVKKMSATKMATTNLDIWRYLPYRNRTPKMPFHLGRKLRTLTFK
jgi:hypothetical protein